MSAGTWLEYPGGLPSLRGTLRVCSFEGSQGLDGGGMSHTSSFVPGRAFDGMEDNDIRGFLDGGFQWAFNQVGQAHVRVGRNAADPMHLRYGEPEIFRILQRWEGIRLPPGSRVTGCTLRLQVEFASDVEQTVMLYAVHHDWNPGVGGIHRNNVSVANPGEVWWNEIGFGERGWGMPGAGFAADEDDADTGQMPLAEALVGPGGTSIEWCSARLADYANDRLQQEEPLLFLLKLSDSCEDEPGSLIGFFSASAGDSLSLEQRPVLEVVWNHPECRVLHEQSVYLEHGRSVDLPMPVTTPGTPLGVCFEPEAESERPTIHVRHKDEGSRHAFQGPDDLFREGSHGDYLRVSALRNPVSLGARIEITFRDTWILTEPAEMQDVSWEFLSPSGLRQRCRGEYRGGYTWSLEFEPDEVGRWQCRLVHALAESPYEGALGVVDVTVEDAGPALRLLKAMIPGISAARDEGDAEQLDLLRRRFIQIQRGLIRDQTPAGLRSQAGVRLREELRDVRSALWGEEVPAEPPFESIRLYSEHDGGPLEDPIPYTRHLKGHVPRPTPGPFLRYRRKIGRLIRRLAGAPGATNDMGGADDE